RLSLRRSSLSRAWRAMSPPAGRRRSIPWSRCTMSEPLKQRSALCSDWLALPSNSAGAAPEFLVPVGGAVIRLLWPVVLILLGSATSVAQSVDAVYYNGRIITMWQAHPVVEAFAVRGNRFLKVGSNEEVMKAAGSHTEKIDLHGHSVTPGLIDSHTHPIMAALPEKAGPVPVIHS